MKFIGGYTFTALHKTIQKISRQGFSPIIDYAKESSHTPTDVLKYIAVMNNMINETRCYKDVAYACKLSSFLPYKPIENIKAIKDKVQIFFLDAEHSYLNNEESMIYNQLYKHNSQIYKTYQMYRKEGLEELQKDLEMYPHLNVKLVRGAYHSKTDLTLFQKKQDTDINYNQALKILSDHMKKNSDIKVCVATHNDYSVKLSCELFKENKSNVCFAQLLDMRDDLSTHIVKQDFKVYKYVPFGTFLETTPYLIRRIYENKDIFTHIMRK